MKIVQLIYRIIRTHGASTDSEVTALQTKAEVWFNGLPRETQPNEQTGIPEIKKPESIIKAENKWDNAKRWLCFIDENWALQTFLACVFIPFSIWIARLKNSALEREAEPDNEINNLIN